MHAVWSVGHGVDALATPVGRRLEWDSAFTCRLLKSPRFVWKACDLVPDSRLDLQRDVDPHLSSSPEEQSRQPNIPQKPSPRLLLHCPYGGLVIVVSQGWNSFRDAASFRLVPPGFPFLVCIVAAALPPPP